MQTFKSKVVAILLILTTATSLFGQGAVTLIGPSSRNGSFEDGVLAPWTDGTSASVAQDSTFASDGEWYCVVSQTATGSFLRPGMIQGMDSDRGDGLTFSLTFDVRNGAAGFDGIRVFFNAFNSDETRVFGDNVFFSLPSVSSLTWHAHQLDFQLPQHWDGEGNVYLGFQFEKGNAAAGTAYTGYLDNVVLTQIPEPSALALLGLGGLCLVGRAVRRRRVADV